MSILPLIIAAIQLSGVTGNRLSARAFFDANNVKVGDLLVLTVDFLGDANFAALHPPALSRSVSRTDWKLDDASSKTDTFRDGRRLTYRVRPMREGVLWFPELEFEYAGTDGEKRIVRSNAIPVHAKPGVDVVVAGMSDSEEDEMPQPDELLTEPPAGLSNHDNFLWRKACSNPTADAFAGFDFAEAKLNEARCAILEGDWDRAISIYSRLEWQIGQTPAIERGLLAALALRFRNPAVELPIWRQVGRPVLRYGWKGRFMLVFGGTAVLIVVFWMLGRVIRALACFAVLLALALPAFAQMRDPFAEMEEMHRQMREHMQQMMSMPFGGGFSFSFGGEAQETPKVSARVEPSKREIQVGEAFEFIVRLEAPKGNTLDQIRITPSETFGLKVVGRSEILTDEASANPSNVVRRLSIPVRYDVPFKGRVSFAVQGMISGRQTRENGRFSFTYNNSFETRSDPIDLEVRPLPSDNQPADFSGIIANTLSMTESLDSSRVETNDVVVITYKLSHDGYVPEDWMPQGAAFMWSDGEWRRYFIADGSAVTPVAEVVFYDPSSKTYKRAKVGGTPLTYVP